MQPEDLPLGLSIILNLVAFYLPEGPLHTGLLVTAGSLATVALAVILAQMLEHIGGPRP